MLVDVVPLRRDGKPRPRAETQAAMNGRPARGMIQIEGCRHLQKWQDKATPKIAQLIIPGTAELLMPGLLFADVQKMRNWQFAVIGKEDRGTDREPIKAGPEQTWWCRVVRS